MTWASPRYDPVNWHGGPWMGIISSEYPASVLVPRRTTVQRVNTEAPMIAEDGSVRLSDLAAKSAYRIRVEHPYITSSHLAYLRAYFLAWGNTTVRITDAQGRIFTCPLPRELDAVQELTSVFYNASVQLEANLA